MTTLAAAGIEFDPEKPLPFVQVELDERGRPRPPGDEVVVRQAEAEVTTTLPAIGEALDAAAPPVDFGDGVPPPYNLLFAAIEGAVADFCATAERTERDREIQRIYRRLRDRPDGDDRNPLYAHLRAVLRVFLSLHPTPPATYEAIFEHLLSGVKRLAHGKDSAHYVARIMKTLRQLEEQAEAEGAGEAGGEAGAAGEAADG